MRRTDVAADGVGRTLPDYMVPAHVVRIEARPLTAHGKLDSRALPAPDGAAANDTAFEAPRTDAERTLCEVWAEVLDVPRVGIDDNYFALGGDSILALRVIAAARARGVPFGIRELYQQHTIRALLRPSTETKPEAAASAIAPFSLVTEADRRRIPDAVEDAYPLTLLQAGMLFHRALDPASAIFQDVCIVHLRLRFDDARSGQSPRASRHGIPFSGPGSIGIPTTSHCKWCGRALRCRSR